MAMTARRLIGGASFGPEAVKTMAEAFDRAWTEVAGNFGTDVRTVEVARLRLANAVLSAASDTSRDPETLKNEALMQMALYYRL
jgi:hypothetical protein